jgi:cell division protein FtsB
VTRPCPICNRPIGYETADACSLACERTAKLIAELRAELAKAKAEIDALNAEIWKYSE